MSLGCVRPSSLSVASPIVLSRDDGNGADILLSVAREMVDKRFQHSEDSKNNNIDKEEHKDMLGSFIRHGATQRQCELEIPFSILAGSDTTATTIRGILLYLSTTRTAYDKLQKEVDGAITSGRISSPIRNDEAKAMGYLQVSTPTLERYTRALSSCG